MEEQKIVVQRLKSNFKVESGSQYSMQGLDPDVVNILSQHNNFDIPTDNSKTQQKQLNNESEFKNPST